jgi:hypothetical protein
MPWCSAGVEASIVVLGFLILSMDQCNRCISGKCTSLRVRLLQRGLQEVTAFYLRQQQARSCWLFTIVADDSSWHLLVFIVACHESVQYENLRQSCHDAHRLLAFQ